MEKKIQTIASLRAHSFSAFLDDVRKKGGERGRRIRIHHPEASAVIPFVSQNEIIMVRQFRYALGRETLEIPAGKVDPGETPDSCAGRELVEETGYVAETLKFLYTYAPAIGYSNELIHIYLGRDLKKVKGRIDDEEINALERISIEDVMGMIKEGLILDGKTLIGLSIMGFLES